MDCKTCRIQCQGSGQKPGCETEQGCPYTPSPGDKSEKGCGLAPENELALWLWPRWKQFGELALNLADLQLKPWEADLLLDKLMMIEEYVPYIQKQAQKREEAKQMVRGRRKR